MELEKIPRPAINRHPLLIAIDGGGTRTRCSVYTLAGATLASVEVGPSNHLSAGSFRTASSLREALARSLSLSKSRIEDVLLLSAGFAGVDVDGAGAEEMRVLLADIGYRNALINGDMVTAQAGAFNGGPGVVAIAGTGASFFGVSESGGRLKAGGYGYCFGDEGGGYWIAVEALRAASRAHDGRDERTALTGPLCQSFGVSTFSDVPGAFYARPFRPDALAQLSLLVAEAASNGDDVATRILKRAGHELAIGASSVARRLQCGSSCPISYQGGVLRNCPLVLQAFEEGIRERIPDAKVQPPLFEAIYGAYLLGLRKLREAKKV